MDLLGGKAVSVRVKICGITTLDDALAAIHYGADGLGFVFAPSKRRVEVNRAREILQALPPLVARIGIFADMPPPQVKEVMEECGLDIAQLHGDETVADCAELAGMIGRSRIVKAFSLSVNQEKDEMGEDMAGNRGRNMDSAARRIWLQMKPYQPYCGAYLLDARLPGQMGGTGQTVNWDLVARLREMLAPAGQMLILAGGLDPHNVGAAVARVQPHAVDVSSGVEEPTGSGRKDPEKIRRFIKAAKGSEPAWFPEDPALSSSGMPLMARVSRSLLLVP